MTKLLKAQLHKRPTYEVLLNDTVRNPKDQIEVICFLKKINLEQVIQDIKDRIEKQNITTEKIFSNIKIHLFLIIILIIFF